MAAITARAYKTRSDAVLDLLEQASDELYRLYEDLNFSTGDSEEEQEFYEDLTLKASRAKRNLEVARENIEVTLDLPLVLQESDATTDPVS